MKWLRRPILALSLLGAIAIASLVETPNVGRCHGRDCPDFDSPQLGSEIPTRQLDAYIDAAEAWDVDWAVLAAIAKLECDHGRSPLAGCSPPGTINVAGARGPFQFRGATWRAGTDNYAREIAGPPAAHGHGWATDGDGDSIADPWSTHDAAHSAARYLVDLGVRDDLYAAARAYNAGPANPSPTAGAGYAAEVVELAAHYHELAGLGGPGSTADVAPAGNGCTQPDPTGTGGCVTVRIVHLLDQIDTHLGDWPWGIGCWSPHPWNPTSDHPKGQACDLTVGTHSQMPSESQRQAGWQAATWLIGNADALAISYVIWDGQIWFPGSGWRPYTGGGVYDPTNPTGGHYDHIHVSVHP